MKKAFKFLVFLFLIPCIGHSQSVEDSRKFLQISNVGTTSFTLVNSYDNTIKIKVKTPINSYEYFLEPHTSKVINPQVGYFSEAKVNSIKLSLYYDLSCYNRDVLYFQKIANSRIRKAESRENFKNSVKFFSGLLEDFTEEGGFLNSAGKAGSAAVEVYELRQEYLSSGFDDASATFIENRLKSLALNSTENNVIRSIGRNLSILYSTEYPDVDLSDIDALIFDSHQLVSNREFYIYGLDYERDFRPIVDSDGDRILSNVDECPTVYGKKRYNGCSREIFIQKRRVKRRANIYSGYFDFKPSFSNFEYLNIESPYLAKTDVNGLMVNVGLYKIRRNIGKSKFTFIPEIGYLWTTYNTPQIEGDDDIIIFRENKVQAALSFGFILNQEANHKIMLQPKVGTLLYFDVRTIDLVYTTSKDEIPKDAFLSSKRDFLTDIFYGGDIRISLGKKSLQDALWLVIGVYHETTPNVYPNPDYSINFDIDDLPFEYSSNKLTFNVGLSLNL